MHQGNSTINLNLLFCQCLNRLGNGAVLGVGAVFIAAIYLGQAAVLGDDFYHAAIIQAAAVTAEKILLVHSDSFRRQILIYRAVRITGVGADSISARYLPKCGFADRAHIECAPTLAYGNGTINQKLQRTPVPTRKPPPSQTKKSPSSIFSILSLSC